jgi:uncharacterized protein (DUF433 family)
MANLNPRITVEPGKIGGKPCIRGLRFTVYDMASYLASGMSEDEILRDFPYLEKEDFRAVYKFFASIPERISVLEASQQVDNLADLFAKSPFHGLDMDFERDKDTGRDIAL